MILEIEKNTENPEILEQLYVEDKNAFLKEYNRIRPALPDNELLKFWDIRLRYAFEKPIRSKFNKLNLIILILLCLLSGTAAKIPAFIHLASWDYFNPRNISFIVFCGMSLYLLWLNSSYREKNSSILYIIFIIVPVYMNLLPYIHGSDTITNACIFLPFFMWCMLGYTYVKFNLKDIILRSSYIKFNGDIIILTGIIQIAGSMLVSLSVGLFQVIGIDVFRFYFEYVVVYGSISAPIVAMYIINSSSIISNKLAPIIAKIFSPLALITLIIYLIIIPIAGKDPYKDRDFLLVFNIMLIAVMAIIVFTVSGISANTGSKLNKVLLFLLACVAGIINLVALSAIFYRITEYGFSPNRIVVLGSNLIIFVNLILVCIRLYKTSFASVDIEKVELTVAKYLPVYFAWTAVVIFVMPWVYWFK